MSFSTAQSYLLVFFAMLTLSTFSYVQSFTLVLVCNEGLRNTRHRFHLRNRTEGWGKERERRWPPYSSPPHLAKADSLSLAARFCYPCVMQQRTLCSDHTTCTRIFHYFWHRRKSTSGSNLDIITVTEWQQELLVFAFWPHCNKFFLHRNILPAHKRSVLWRPSGTRPLP